MGPPAVAAVVCASQKPPSPTEHQEARRRSSEFTPVPGGDRDADRLRRGRMSVWSSATRRRVRRGGKGGRGLWGGLRRGG